MNRIILGDNLDVLPTLPDRAVRLAYIDPPFNTGKAQARTHLRTTADADGDRIGFGGRRYRTEKLASSSYADRFDDFVQFLMPRIERALPCLTEDASIFVHLDYREVHYVKVALDKLLGRDHFMNEIIWAYDFGGRPRNRWPCKHDTILWYALDPDHYVYNYDAVDRIPYMAPGLVTREKAARGKTPTDVWWHTIVPTNGREKTGYPTQKPLGVIERIVKVHTEPGDTVLDFFAGSGTLGAAAAAHGRRFILIDNNIDAVRIMEQRLAAVRPKITGCQPTTESPSMTPTLPA